MSKAWMPLYIGDYLGDTGHLSQSQHGAYLLLLMHCWQKGFLPGDIESINNIAKSSTDRDRTGVANIVKDFFRLDGDRYTHPRIQKELARVEQKTEVRRAAGSRGGRAKWGDSNAPNIPRSKRLAKAKQIACHTTAEWLALLSFCRHSCVKCSVSSSQMEIVKDHITPLYQGGSDGIENLQPLCLRCNSAKGSEAVDYRPEDWEKCLAKVLASAFQCASDCDSDSSSGSKEEIEGQVHEIASLYPKVLDAFHLTREVAQVIAEAIARDGRDVVWVGTKSAGEAMKSWPPQEKQFIPSAPRFFRESQYRKSPEEWIRNGKAPRRTDGWTPPQNVPADYVPESVKRRQELAERKAQGL